MWRFHENGTREFLAGKADWTAAAREAQECDAFREDVEEEIVADELRSCYNCRFRRWTASSFMCMHPVAKMVS